MGDGRCLGRATARTAISSEIWPKRKHTALLRQAVMDGLSVAPAASPRLIIGLHHSRGRDFARQTNQTLEVERGSCVRVWLNSERTRQGVSLRNLRGKGKER